VGREEDRRVAQGYFKWVKSLTTLGQHYCACLRSELLLYVNIRYPC
jgi:hypothetical protein